MVGWMSWIHFEVPVAGEQLRRCCARSPSDGRTSLRASRKSGAFAGIETGGTIFPCYPSAFVDQEVPTQYIGFAVEPFLDPLPTDLVDDLFQGGLDSEVEAAAWSINSRCGSRRPS